MFSEVIESSNVIEVISEEAQDSSVKLMLRVLDKKRWGKMLKALLVENTDEEEYGVAINKSYWAEEVTKQITFCWVLIIWGDLDEALEDLKPLLSKKVGPPKPPPELPVVTGKGMKTILKRQHFGIEDGGRGSATIIQLPHRNAPVRNKKTNKTKKIGSPRKGRWAYAELIGGDEGNPW